MGSFRSSWYVRITQNMNVFLELAVLNIIRCQGTLSNIFPLEPTITSIVAAYTVSIVDFNLSFYTKVALTKNNLCKG